MRLKDSHRRRQRLFSMTGHKLPWSSAEGPSRRARKQYTKNKHRK